MIPLSSGTKIWLVAGIIDMRNGFNGLAAKVQTALKDDPMSGHVFIFRGRSGSLVKLLWSTGDACCGLLSPQGEALQNYVLTDGKLHADDTLVPVLGNKKTKTGRLWAYDRDNRNAGSSLVPAVWFAFSSDRKSIHPPTHLADFSGVLQADAYAGFNELYREGHIKEAACWAHDRRKIHDVQVRTRQP